MIVVHGAWGIHSFLFLLLLFFLPLFLLFFPPLPGPLAPLPSLKGPTWPWVLAALPVLLGPEASGGITVGLWGAEVGGRRAQRCRRSCTLHVFVPLRRIHLRRPKMTGD